MIVHMKEITLICLESDKINTLEELRKLGVMHVAPMKKSESEDGLDLAKQFAETERALDIASSRSSKKKPSAQLTGKEASGEILSLLEKQVLAEKEIDALRREETRLLPWGDFDRKSIEEIEQKGIHVYLCIVPRSDFNDFLSELPDSASNSIISQDKAAFHIAVFSQEKLDAVKLGAVSLPEQRLSDISKALADKKLELADITENLDVLSHFRNEIREYAGQLAARLEFTTNRDGMEKSGAVAYIKGYVPVTMLDRLKTAASVNGWGLLIEDPPEDDEEVPTYIEKPKWLNIMDPVFDFIGITPGYRESDVNMFFIIFFPIFFGLLIGDAAYGFLFMTVALILKFTVCRGKESMRLPLNLFIFLSCYSILWGWLNGSWFGVPREMLPGFMQGLNFFADPEKSPAATKLAEHLNIYPVDMMKDKIVQWICFFVAALHLSLARIVKFFDGIRGSWRAIGQLGWAMFLWANFFTAVNLIVFPGTFPKVFALTLYIGGAVLIIGTTHLKSYIDLPNAFIGSFVDILSYIRLFAVGLSGAYIAMNFNMMGGMLLKSFPDHLYVLGLFCLVIVAIFGHLLNIGLSFLGVLVHAIRLNTLEFSNHMEMQWTGKQYRPFAENDKETE